MRIPYRPVWAPLVGALSWSPDESRITPQGHPLCVPLWIHPNLRSSKPQSPPTLETQTQETAQDCHQNASLSMLQCDRMNDPGMNSLQQPTDTRKDTIAPLTRRPHHPPGRPAEPVLTFGTVVCLSIASVDSSAATQFGIPPRRGAADAKCAPQQEPEYGNHLTQPDMNPTFPAMTRLFQTRPDMNRPNPPIHVILAPQRHGNRRVSAFEKAPKRLPVPEIDSPKQVKPVHNRTVEFDGTQN